jgi:hypothetical protein
MKVDVVACYYRQAEFSSFFALGMLENSEEIGHVYVVNDEPWDPAERRAIERYPITCLDHPHDGYGVSKSLNQGILASTAEYVFTMSFDQILALGCLASALEVAGPGRLIIGNVHTIAPDTSLDELPYPRIISHDPSASKASALAHMGRSWMFARNGHTMMRREDHLAVGGFNEAFKSYGLEDYEYGARWLAKFGPSSIGMGTGVSWHFGDTDTSIVARAHKMPPHENYVLLLKALAPLHSNRYALFAEKGAEPTHVRVSHVGTTPMDVMLDCWVPDWLPDGVNEVVTRLQEVPMDLLSRHVGCIAKRLNIGGSIVLADGIRLDMGLLTCLAVESGLTIEIDGDKTTLVREEA